MASPHSELIVSVSGIRGIIGDSLTPDAALRFAEALGTASPGRIVLARDSRPSGEMLKHAVIAGLLSTGCTVEDIGIAPTPSVGVAVRAVHAAGAIMITASHNPSPWNGLKLFGADGAVLPPAQGRQIQERFLANKFEHVTWDKQGQVSTQPDALDPHLESVLKHVPIEPILKRNFRVFVDGNGGAGGPLAVRLLQLFGCEVIALNCEADGHFAHEPEPTPAHLGDVAPKIASSRSHIGLVLDPDADRLALIDETGQCVSEELTLALAVQYRLTQAQGPVVVNMSTSRVIQDITEVAGCEFFRSAVGEANVVSLMRQKNALIGGEGNGGVIDPRIGWVRDPFIGMALILSHMAEQNLPLSELVKRLPPYAMLKTKFSVPPDKLQSTLESLPSLWPEAQVNTLDGLRLDGPKWWLHVRPSNTEPVVRVIAEASTLSEAQALCDRAAATMRV